MTPGRDVGTLFLACVVLLLGCLALLVLLAAWPS